MADRTALVTGGGRGLGRAIAAELAARGWRVGLIARTAGEVEEAAASVREAGGDARAFAADVTDPASLDAAFRRLRGWSDRLDALVLAAGRLRSIAPLEAADADAWWLDLATTLRGAQLAAARALPLLRASGRGSITALIGPGFNGELAFASGYAAAQAGLARLVECLAVELTADAIPAYALNPGIVPTALMRHLIDTPEGRRRLPRFNEAFAEGKEVGPEVVAEMAAWLAERRPMELSGRVVAAAMTPELLETRLDRIRADDRNRLRLC